MAFEKMFLTCILSFIRGEAAVDVNALTAPLPSQCDNAVLELSPIRYIADGSNYTNCTLKGQIGTVIQGLIGGNAQPRLMSATLSGSMILDGASVHLDTLYIKGDKIIVNKSIIETRLSWVGAFAVLGGNVTFLDTQLLSNGPSTVRKSNVFFTRSWMSYKSNLMSFECSESHVYFKDSSVSVTDDQHISFTDSFVDLWNSSLSLGHGHFELVDSTAAFSGGSSVYLNYGIYSPSPMLIKNSNVWATCGEGAPVFEIGRGVVNSDVSIAGSELSFTNCSCDMSQAIRVTELASTGGVTAGIDIDKSSIHFGGCAAPYPPRRGDGITNSFVV